jgi:pyruvate ferredoxin oxidoreductase alpha subunit
VTFLDLNTEAIQHELERERASRRSGPTAEALLRKLGGRAARTG